MQKRLHTCKPTLVVVAVNKIKTHLWYMQEDKESFGQSKLGTKANILGSIMV